MMLSERETEYVPVTMRGLWERKSLSVNGEMVEDDSRVLWMQGSKAFVDLRVPSSRSPVISFAGDTQVRDASIRFRHDIDLIPSIAEDAAEFHWIDPDTLVETGKITTGGGDLSFTEVWRRQSPLGADGRTWRLRDSMGTTKGVAVSVGRFLAVAHDGRDIGDVYRALILKKTADGWLRALSVGCDLFRTKRDHREIELILREEVSDDRQVWMEE
jgi:hypothetical protein